MTNLLIITKQVVGTRSCIQIKLFCCLKADPANADPYPDPSQTLKSQKVEFLH
jgi:hypothetical protein